MSDLIDRQQAIDAMLGDKVQITNVIRAIGNERDFEVLNCTCDRHAEIIKALPTVQLGMSLAEVGTYVPEMNVGDMISRQVAMEMLMAQNVIMDGSEYHNGFNAGVNRAQEVIRNLSPVQPKHGKWIERNPLNSDKCRLIECDQCGNSYIVGFNVPYEHWTDNRNYCEKCGADMRCSENPNS